MNDLELFLKKFKEPPFGICGTYRVSGHNTLHPSLETNGPDNYKHNGELKIYLYNTVTKKEIVDLSIPEIENKFKENNFICNATFQRSTEEDIFIINIYFTDGSVITRACPFKGGCLIIDNNIKPVNEEKYISLEMFLAIL